MKKSSTYKDCINSILSLLREIDGKDDREKISQSLSVAREKIFAHLKEFPNDPEINYLAGLIMYESSNNGEDFKFEIEKYFHKALSLSPNHQFAKMYLGHYYFDCEKYQEALLVFESVDEDYFLVMNQKWRILKLRELILCCKCYLNSSSLSEKSFEALVKEYLAADDEDVPLPLELSKMFFLTRGNSIWRSVNRQSVKKLVIEMLKKLSFLKPLQHYFVEDVL